MTSDAKIGLLLGLGVIVIIAFLINGLPGLLNSASSDTLLLTEYQKKNAIIRPFTVNIL